MKYNSIIPEGFVPSEQCVKGLLAKSKEMSELSKKAFHYGAFRLSSTLLDIASLYSRAAGEAWESQLAAADRRHAKAMKEIEAIHARCRSEEVPF